MDFEEVFEQSEVRQLMQAFLTLRTEEDIRSFLTDLCTPREIWDFAQRLEVARHLDVGESYASVQERTGVSSTTVSRVSKTLSEGEGGYQRVFERLDEGE